MLRIEEVPDDRTGDHDQPDDGDRIARRPCQRVMVRQHQEDDGQGQVVVVGRAELGLLAELRVGRATGQQFGDHLLLVRDDDEEDAGRHPGGDHRAGMEKGGTAVEDLGEGEGGKKDIDEERDAENDTVPAERRAAQALIDEPAHHDAADADGRRLPELEGADSWIDSVEIGVKVIDPDDEEEAADPGGIALPLEPGQFLRQFGRRNKVLAHVVEPAAVNLPRLAAYAFRKAVPLLQAEIQVNEVEGRADPGDGGDHVGPADDLADPLGNLRVDHAGPWAMERALTLAHRAEKWTRFSLTWPFGSLTRPSGSALDDAFVRKEHRMNPKSAVHFWVRCSAVISFAKGRFRAFSTGSPSRSFGLSAADASRMA